MLLPVDVFNTAWHTDTVQAECIIFEKIAVVRPHGFKTVSFGTNLFNNAAAKAARTKYFNAAFISSRIDAQTIGKSAARVDPDLPGG